MKKCDAVTTYEVWGRSAFAQLQEATPDIVDKVKTSDLENKIASMVCQRAMQECFDKPKIRLQYEYPIGLFTGRGGAKSGFENSLPSTLTIVKTYIPFRDGSCFLLQIPSEEIVELGSLIKVLKVSAEMRSAFGVKSGDLSGFEQIDRIASGVNPIVPCSAEQIKEILNKESAGYKVFGGLEPRVFVNLSNDSIPASQALGLLMDFLDHPSDTVQSSISDWLKSQSRRRAAFR